MVVENMTDLEQRLRAVENQLSEIKVRIDLMYSVTKGMVALVSLALGIDLMPLLGGV